MRLMSRLRRRLFGKRIKIDVADEDLAFMLQMGWAEKTLGAYIITDRGIEELYTIAKEMK